ncbi:MAG: hypothetical protein ABFS10_05780 [Bacteroidota bacterium]
MNTRTLLATIILLNIKFLYGQVDETRNFIYLYSDSVVYGEIIEFKTPFLGASHILVDSRKYSTELIKFYRNETGFYANTKEVYISLTPYFTQRIRSGRLNLFESDIVKYTSGHFSSSTGHYTPGSSTRKIKNYYNKGYSNLKKANYKNLSLDLTDNPKSMLYLKKYKSATTGQTVLYLVGGAIAAGGLATLIIKTNDADFGSESGPNITSNFVVTGIGAGMVGVGYYISLNKPKHLRNAITVYNSNR